MKKTIMAMAVVACVFGASGVQADTNLILNGDFGNSNVITPGTFLYANGFTNVVVSDPGWTFVDGTGIANNSSTWGGVASNQIVAFMQSYDGFSSNSPSISQSFASSSSAFVISFDLAQRANHAGIESITVLLDNKTAIANLAPASGAFSPYSFTVTGLTGSTHTLTFKGVNPTQSDSTLFLDNVSVNAVSEPETYAMLMAGLGLMCCVAYRRMPKADAWHF
jgi:hypothetical protein